MLTVVQKIVLDSANQVRFMPADDIHRRPVNQGDGAMFVETVYALRHGVQNQLVIPDQPLDLSFGPDSLGHFSFQLNLLLFLPFE